MEADAPRALDPWAQSSPTIWRAEGFRWSSRQTAETFSRTTLFTTIMALQTVSLRPVPSYRRWAILLQMMARYDFATLVVSHCSASYQRGHRSCREHPPHCDPVAFTFDPDTARTSQVRAGDGFGLDLKTGRPDMSKPQPDQWLSAAFISTQLPKV
jgi:hypothetical protein